MELIKDMFSIILYQFWIQIYQKKKKKKKKNTFALKSDPYQTLSSIYKSWI